MTPTTLDPGEARAVLPQRLSDRPRTTATNPHRQLGQQSARPPSGPLVAHAAKLEGVLLGPSDRAPRGKVGFHPSPVAPSERSLSSCPTSGSNSAQTAANST